MSLREQLEQRIGRLFGNCHECGKPTRSHKTASGLRCHSCHSGGGVLLTDGGDYQDECPRCNGEDGFKQADLCPKCIVEYDPDEAANETDFSDQYDESDWVEGELPQGEHAKRAHWMIGGTDLKPKDRPKAPIGPWGAEIGDSHPTKWSYPTNYASQDVAVEWMEKDPRAEHTIYIQWEESELAFVDGDDVYCEGKGEFHPEFKRILDKLGPTYLDISTSLTGSHGTYIGTLPEGAVSEPTFAIDDEPWGSNDEVPEVEIYTTKHVCVMTGRHVVGTPDEAKTWDQGGLESILEEYDQMEDEPVNASDFEPLPDDYEPGATANDETTEDINDVMAAVDRLTADDLPIRSRENGSESSGWTLWDPSYRQSDSGESLHLSPDRTTFDDKNYGWSFGVLRLFAAEEGIISSPDDRLSGAEWWEAIEAARDHGAPIPEYDPGDGSGWSPKRVVDTVTLPTLKDRIERMGWTYDDRGSKDDITQSAVYDRTHEKIIKAMDRGGPTLIDGIMGSGKTYSSFKAAKELDEPILYTAPRSGLYVQGVEYAEEVGFDRENIKLLPSMFDDCPAASGEFGDAIQDRIRALHNLNVTPKGIHGMMDDIPCEEGDDACPYRQAMKFDPDNYDVIVGHYKHAHLPQVASGRHVIVDEEPTDAYLTHLNGDDLITAVNTFLSFDESPPVEDFQDLLNAREDPERVEEIHAWFSQYGEREGWDPDELNAFRYESQNYHALTPHAVYAIALGGQLAESDWYRITIDGRNPIVFREADENVGYSVTVNRPPSDALQYARSVIGLDGTPMTLGPDDEGRKTLGKAPLWNLALNKKFRVERVLSDDERKEWLQETQNVQIVPTTEYVKPYSSGKYANRRSDFAVIQSGVEQVGHDPLVITTKAVRGEYQEADDELSANVTWDHYGNIRGSNEYASERLCVLLGSPHYGDEWLAERAALLGFAIEPEGKGADREYGSGVGNALLRSMRESTIAQAALRPGRDGKGAVVLIHTSAYPEWLPIAGRGSVHTTWSDAQRDAYEYVFKNDGVTTAEVADAVGRSERQALNILSGLEDSESITHERSDGDSRTFEWRTDDEEFRPIYGDTELPSDLVDTDGESKKKDVQKFIRKISYTASASRPAEVHHHDRGRDLGVSEGDPPDSEGAAAD